MSSEPSASTRVAESFESVESDWVLDSLIGFLNGPVWQHPLLIFCEQKSVVFDPEDDESCQEEYRKVFEEYKVLVDKLLGCHMEELGISPEQFEDAIDEAEGILSTKFHQTLFEQVWAAADFPAFKRMMIQLNIDFQLHALEILSSKLGLIPSLFLPDGLGPDDFVTDEDFFLKEGVRRSLAEIETEEALQKLQRLHCPSQVDPDMIKFNMNTDHVPPYECPANVSQTTHPKVIEITTTANPMIDYFNDDDNDDGDEEKLEVFGTKGDMRRKSSELPVTDVQKEVVRKISVPHMMKPETSRRQPATKSSNHQKVVEEKSTNSSKSTKNINPKETKSLPQNTKGTPSDHPVASSSSTSSEPFHRPQTAKVREDVMRKLVPTPEGISPEEIKHRQEYLRKQRDKLLEIKKDERQKQLHRMEENAKNGVRPKTVRGSRGSSAASIRSASGSDMSDEEKGLLYRKALAARIKSEVVECPEDEDADGR